MKHRECKRGCSHERRDAERNQRELHHPRTGCHPQHGEERNQTPLRATTSMLSGPGGICMTMTVLTNAIQRAGSMSSRQLSKVCSIRVPTSLGRSRKYSQGSAARVRTDRYPGDRPDDVPGRVALPPWFRRTIAIRRIVEPSRLQRNGSSTRCRAGR